MSQDTAGVIAQIFGTLLVALLVEDRAVVSIQGWGSDLRRCGTRRRTPAQIRRSTIVIRWYPEWKRAVSARSGEDRRFLDLVFMLGLISSGLGLLVVLPAMVWENRSSDWVVGVAAVCLISTLFALVVPAAHRLPEMKIFSSRWANETLKSGIIVGFVCVVPFVVLFFLT